MFFNDEVNICIKAYKQALIHSNLNMLYLKNNRLDYGLCHFARSNNLNSILNKYEQDFNTKKVGLYICESPLIIYSQALANEDFKNKLIESHNKRIQYLENLLTTI
jgi:hypothetical protein